MIEAGADVIDIGAQSTKPRADLVSVVYEIEKVVPIVTALKTAYPHIEISVDTMTLGCAKASIDAGADIINDVSFLSNPEFAVLCANNNKKLVIMHSRGDSYTMDEQTYYTSLVDEIYEEIYNKTIVAQEQGLNKKNIIIDVGFGFAKTIEQNFELLRRINEFKSEVKKRITDLANKNYQNAGDLSQPDFVLMYMPIESSVNLLYEDADLIKQAYKSNIIIVGTASLLTTIRLVNQLLAQQKQSESVAQIVNAGANLYDTFVQFCEDLIDVQKRMDDVSSKLTTTINRFKRGNKNKPSLFSQVNALKDFGINSNKEIPANLIEEVLDDEVILEAELVEVSVND